jgi:hypothetical protein
VRPVSSMLGMVGMPWAKRRWQRVVLQSVAVAVTAAMCLVPPAVARAGYYEAASPLYSGPGQVTLNPPIPPLPFPYAVTQYGYGGAYGGGGQVNCSGLITATYNWVPDAPGDTPPANVIVREDCTAFWQAYTIGPPPSGGCDNGLNSGVVDLGPIPGIPSPPFTTRWFASSGTRYRVVAGTQPLTITRNPSASASSPIFASASVYYTCSVAPADVIFAAGTDIGPSGAQRYLVGMPASASLATGGLTGTSFIWSVDGCNPFTDYSPTTPTLYQALIQPWQSSVSCFFAQAATGDDPKLKATFSCAAHLAIPPGCKPDGGLDVNASRQCTVEGPAFGLQASIGVPTLVGSPPTKFQLRGASLGNYTGDGTYWRGTALAASEWESLYGVGVICYVQIINPNRRFVDGQITWVNMQYPFSGFCDSGFPYSPNPSPFPASQAANGTYLYGGDSPGQDLNGQSGWAHDTFDTYLMYIPDLFNGRWVPLATWHWWWGGTVTLNGGSWRIDDPSAGIDPNLVPYPGHPQWTYLHNTGWRVL